MVIFKRLFIALNIIFGKSFKLVEGRNVLAAGTYVFADIFGQAVKIFACLFIRFNKALQVVKIHDNYLKKVADYSSSLSYSEAN